MGSKTIEKEEKNICIEIIKRDGQREVSTIAQILPPIQQEQGSLCPPLVSEGPVKKLDSWQK